MKKRILNFIFILICIFVFVSLISAGVGIKWSKESVLVNEGERTCLSYSVYNPWPEDTYVSIEPSDEIKIILTMQDAKIKLIPADTSSSEAIPVEFCFKVPNVYEKDCWLAGKFICEQRCEEEQKVYSGDVIVQSIAPENQASGVGGSTTTMSVSAPLNIRIRCNAYSRDFALIYVLLAMISVLAISIILYKKYREPKVERDRKRLKKLKELVKRETKKRRK
ncbi:MAG: hypothetical protein NTU63_00915 [Candidatus Pacearchaeota archaeon]|nr:hypothetical protein [Candidatus Pacearchaeota archaeon]